MSFHVNVLDACLMSGLVLLESFPQHTARKRLKIAGVFNLTIGSLLKGFQENIAEWLQDRVL